jgi:hypothetical protein
VAFVWADYAVIDSPKIWTRTLSSAGSLGSAQGLSGTGAAGPRVVAGEDGQVTFGWSRFDGTRQRVQVRTRSATGVLGSVVSLSAANGSGFGTALAVAGESTVLAAWAFSGTGEPFIQASAGP